ncbi:metal-sensitive transcriptional regulator [Methylobacterium komagatae]
MPWRGGCVAESEITDGRVVLHRTEDERTPLVQHLNRIEGRVRGLRAMIEEDRHCLDEIAQINAARAALREVALIIIDQHVAECVKLSASGTTSAAVVEDLMRVLQAAMQAQT